MAVGAPLLSVEAKTISGSRTPSVGVSKVIGCSCDAGKGGNVSTASPPAPDEGLRRMRAGANMSAPHDPHSPALAARSGGTVRGVPQFGQEKQIITYVTTFQVLRVLAKPSARRRVVRR